MKNFKQFISEEPLPLDIDYRDVQPPPGRYTSKSVEEKFRSFGLEVGKGSSRIAFKVTMPASRFKDLNTHGVKLSGMVNTVFKLALHMKGVAQNKAEIQNWNKAVQSGVSDFLLPILDTSKDNTQRELKINNQNSGIKFNDSESNWIQMPYASPVDENQLEKEFIKLFGDWKQVANDNDLEINDLYTDEDGNNPYSYVLFEEPNWKKMLNKILKYDKEGNEIITTEQRNNIKKLIKTITVLNLGEGDLGAAPNWGMFNGQLKILDYGFAGDVIDIYVGTSKAIVTVNDSGEINIVTNKK